MASKFHGGGNKKDKMLAMYYAKYVAPHLMASFALTLYDKTDLSVEDITNLCIDVNDLWTRSTAEGWDICKNCEELTGIDMKSWIEMKEPAKKGNKFTEGV